MYTPTGSHSTVIAVGSKTGKPIDLEYDSVAFTYINVDQLNTKTYLLNSVPVRINTYTYNGSGLLTNIAVEML